MNSFGDTIKQLRKNLQLPLRTVAAYLDIDQAILSKIERGQRIASRELVVKLANYFKIKEEDLLISWLSDKLVLEVEKEDVALKALQVAEEKLEYIAFRKIDRTDVLKRIKETLKKFDKIKKAWIFGSFAREDDAPDSDIDIAIEADPDFSYFDLAEVQYKLEMQVNRKFDVGFIESFKPHILNNIRPNLKLIYER